jgi:hypothetical protein
MAFNLIDGYRKTSGVSMPVIFVMAVVLMIDFEMSEGREFLYLDTPEVPGILRLNIDGITSHLKYIKIFGIYKFQFSFGNHLISLILNNMMGNMP